MALNLMVFTRYFSIEPKDIRDGISYRYVGLYGSLVRILLNYSPESKIFWYSYDDCCLRLISQKNVLKKRSSIIKAVVVTVFKTVKNRSNLIVVIAFPSAVPRIQRIFEYVFSFLALKILGVGLVRIIVDDFDPPIMAAYGFAESEPSTLWMFYSRILEMLTLKLSDYTLTASESCRQYLSKLYRIKKEKILVVQNVSLVRYVSYVQPKLETPLTILYAGSAMKVKGVDKLVSIVNQLRERGLELKLHIAGAKLMDLPGWVQIGSYNWPCFVRDVLCRSDICVIPYPARNARGYKFFSYAMPNKIFDYMAAGKPVISTNLKETGNLIKMSKCGLVANDWKEFTLLLKKLYYDRELARKLGENGRRAAERYFNYEAQAEALFNKLIKMFESCNRCRTGG